MARPAGQPSTAHKGLNRARHGPQGPGKSPDRAASSSPAASTTSSAFSPSRSFPSSYPSPSGVSPASSPSGSSSSPLPSFVVASSLAPSPSAPWLPSSMSGPQSLAALAGPLSSSSMASVAMPSGGGSAKSGRSPALSTSTFPIWSSSVDPKQTARIGPWGFGAVHGVGDAVPQYGAVRGGGDQLRRHRGLQDGGDGRGGGGAGGDPHRWHQPHGRAAAGMVGREERDASEILLPQCAEDLIILLQRSMFAPGGSPHSCFGISVLGTVRHPVGREPCQAWS